MASQLFHARSFPKQGSCTRPSSPVSPFAGEFNPFNVKLQDKTFTSTLFAPKAEFDRVDTPEMTLTWFKSYFSDALSIIGEETLLKDFKRNPRSPLISTKVRFAL